MRFELKEGKFGFYYRDNDRDVDLNLGDVDIDEADFEQNKFIVINRKRFEELSAAANGTNIYQIKYAARCIENLENAIKSFQEMYEEKVDRKMDQKYYVCNQDEPYAQQVIDCILNYGKDQNDYI